MKLYYVQNSKGDYLQIRDESRPRWNRKVIATLFKYQQDAISAAGGIHLFDGRLPDDPCVIEEIKMSEAQKLLYEQNVALLTQ